MKARIKATGEIVEVMYSHTAQDKGYDIIWYTTPRGACFSKEELDFTNVNTKIMREETMIEAINDIDSIRCMVEDIHGEITNTPDYWTRLEHTYAGMAMQGILSDNVAMEQIVDNQEGTIAKIIANFAVTCATTLVEKLKEKEERKCQQH